MAIALLIGDGAAAHLSLRQGRNDTEGFDLCLGNCLTIGNDIISWADMYDSASMESKKMIVNCLIKRIEVRRNYKLHIDFNIDLEQFWMCSDITAAIA